MRGSFVEPRKTLRSYTAARSATAKSATAAALPDCRRPNAAPARLLPGCGIGAARKSLLVIIGLRFFPFLAAICAAVSGRQVGLRDWHASRAASARFNAASMSLSEGRSQDSTASVTSARVTRLCLWEAAIRRARWAAGSPEFRYAGALIM